MSFDPPQPHATTVGVILAGGLGSRFHANPEQPDLHGHKLLTDFRGMPLYRWALDALVASRLETWVVWGALSDEAPTLKPSVTVLHNPRWAEGMATSLQVAVSHARESGVETLVIGLADQPLIPSSAWADVAASTATPIAANSAGTKGHCIFRVRSAAV